MVLKLKRAKTYDSSQSDYFGQKKSDLVSLGLRAVQTFSFIHEE